jgi:hypothetical protein
MQVLSLLATCYLLIEIIKIKQMDSNTNNSSNFAEEARFEATGIDRDAVEPENNSRYLSFTAGILAIAAIFALQMAITDACKNIRSLG